MMMTSSRGFLTNKCCVQQYSILGLFVMHVLYNPEPSCIYRKRSEPSQTPGAPWGCMVTCLGPWSRRASLAWSGSLVHLVTVRRQVRTKFMFDSFIHVTDPSYLDSFAFTNTFKYCLVINLFQIDVSKQRNLAVSCHSQRQ